MVHRELGCGFSEPVYQEAFAVELELRGIEYHREVEIPIRYKGRPLRNKYRADFICYSSVIVELKALSAITGTEDAQLINYLRATSHEVGLLLNFGGRSLEHKRLVI